MKKLWAALAGVGLVATLAAPAGAGIATDARDTAISACKDRGGKKVTITVNVDGETIRYKYRCSKLTATTTTAKPQPYTPVPTDFQIGVIVLEQQCFGSAGCLIDFRIDVEYVGALLPATGETFEVIYTVNGGESPKTNRFKITGSQITYPSEESISTPADPVLTATVTSVLGP